MNKAIKIAARAGLPLKIAAKVDKADLEYYNDKIKSHCSRLRAWNLSVRLATATKVHFLGNAMALLFPIDWPEPFGLAMIEAMANGTPVIAFQARLRAGNHRRGLRRALSSTVSMGQLPHFRMQLASIGTESAVASKSGSRSSGWRGTTSRFMKRAGSQHSGYIVLSARAADQPARERPDSA